MCTWYAGQLHLANGVFESTNVEKSHGKLSKHIIQEDKDRYSEKCIRAEGERVKTQVAPISDPKKHLITGGAGFLGINLIRYLLQRGHQVVSFDMAEFDYEDVRDQTTVISGDIRDAALVNQSMQDIDIVVHAAAALPLYSKEEIFSIDIDGKGCLLNDNE